MIIMVPSWPSHLCIYPPPAVPTRPGTRAWISLQNSLPPGPAGEKGEPLPARGWEETSPGQFFQWCPLEGTRYHPPRQLEPATGPTQWGNHQAPAAQRDTGRWFGEELGRARLESWEKGHPGWRGVDVMAIPAVQTPRMEQNRPGPSGYDGRVPRR